MRLGPDTEVDSATKQRKKVIDVSASESVGVFVAEVDAPRGQLVAKRDRTERLRRTQVAPMHGKPFTLDLFDGTSVTLTPTEVTASSPRGLPGVSPDRPLINWIGEQRDNAGNVLATGSFVLHPSAAGGYAIAGSISNGGPKLTIMPVDDLARTHVLTEGTRSGDDVNEELPGDLRAGDEPTARPASDQALAAASTLTPQTPGTQAPDGPYIDLLLAHVSSLPALAVLQSVAQVNDTNSALISSGLSQRIRLVDVMSVNYAQHPAPQGVFGDTDRMRTPNGAHLQVVRDRRDQVRADLVVLVVPLAINGCGYGDTPPQGGSQMQSGFATAAQSCFGDQWVIPHELGHLMGANHDPGNLYPGDGDPFSYARGHFEMLLVRDLMTYEGACGCGARLQYSNPSVSFIGLPGHPSGTAARDNARSMRSLAPIVYDYRALWSGPESLGAAPLTNDPSPVTWGPGHHDVFWRSGSNQLWHKWYNQTAGGWAGPQLLDTSAMAGDPKPVSWGPGHIDVFWKAADNTIVHRYYVNGWNAAVESMNTLTVASDPAPVSWGPGFIDLFWKGTNGELWHKTYLAGSGWSNFESLGAPCSGACGFASDPKPISWGPGHIAVFVKGLDGNLWVKSYNGGWQGWQLVGGGPLGGDPQPVSWGPGHLDVYWRGTDNQVWHMGYILGSWTIPTTIGSGTIASDPMPVSWGSGQLDVYWRTSSNALRYRRFNTAWRPVATLASSGLMGVPSPVSWGLDHAEVFWRGPGDDLWHVYHAR